MENIIMKTLQDPNMIFDMILHGLILFTFLTLFFSFYVSIISENVFNEEVTNMIDNSIDDALDNIKTDINSMKLKQIFVNKLPLTDLEKYYEGKNMTLDAINKGVLNGLWISNIILWACFIIGTYLVYDIYNIHVKEILTENILSFILIGIAEYLFFTRIGLHFVPVEPSFISSEFLNQTKSKLK